MKKQTKNKTWRKVKLGDIANISYGKNLPTRELKSVGFPVYGGNGVIGYSDQYLFKDPKIIVSCRGAYSGNIFKTKPKSFVTHNSLVLNFKDKTVYEPFMFYKLLQSNVKSTVTGSAQPQITITELEQLGLALPSEENQKRIAAILSAFDDKIELNNKISRTLEEMAQAIFKEWFVDFRFPGYEKVKFIDSELGKIPEEWEVKKLEKIAQIKYGKGPAGKDFKKDGYPVYGANGIIGYYGKYEFEESQIIVGCRGVVGSLFKTLPKSSVTHNSLIIKPKNFCSKNYLFWILKNANLQSVVGGSAQPQITIKDLSQLPILLAKKDIQQQFESLVERMGEKHLSIYYENQKLSSLRDLLLPKLMSGEIKV